MGWTRRERRTSLTRAVIVCAAVGFPAGACTSVVGVSDITFVGAEADGDTVSPSCFEVTGSGESRECAYGHIAAPGYACASTYAIGSCPSPALVGCCVTTTTNDGNRATAAYCYYGTANASAAKKACIESDEKWQTDAPEAVE